MNSFNKSLICILILTIVGSILTYRIVVKAYDGAYGDAYLEAKILKYK